MDFAFLWFCLLGVLLAGYAVLDGFDLGVGIIHPLMRGERERSAAVKAIGPLWDGNEVWLVTFGGGLFAAFPEAYSTILSALYDPIFLLLFCLIARAVSVDFRHKVHSKPGRAVFDAGFFISSLLATFVFGAAAGILIEGLPLDERGESAATTWQLIGWYPMATGLLAVATFALHGVSFLYLKVTGTLRNQLSRWIWTAWGIFLVVYVLVSMMTLIENPHVIERVRRAPWAIPVVILNVLCVANIPRSIYQNQYGQAFVSSCINIACLVVLFGVSTFPFMVFSTSAEASLTIETAASSLTTLRLMSWLALLGAPFIAAYTVIIYWTFREPIET